MGRFMCIATNVAGSTASPPVFIECDPVKPVVTVDLPATFHAKRGEAVRLEVAGAGLPLPVYSWFKDGVKLRASGPAFTIDSLQDETVGSYQCVLASDAGVTRSRKCKLSIEEPVVVPPPAPAPAPVPVPAVPKIRPSIRSQPASRLLRVGETYKLRVVGELHGIIVK